MEIGGCRICLAQGRQTEINKRPLQASPAKPALQGGGFLLYV
jgi:hypothetical protein